MTLPCVTMATQWCQRYNLIPYYSYSKVRRKIIPTNFPVLIMYLFLTHGKLNLKLACKIGKALTFILIVFTFELQDQWHLVFLMHPFFKNFFSLFLGLYLQHVEVPRLGVE